MLHLGLPREHPTVRVSCPPCQGVNRCGDQRFMGVFVRPAPHGEQDRVCHRFPEPRRSDNPPGSCSGVRMFDAWSKGGHPVEYRACLAGAEDRHEPSRLRESAPGPVLENQGCSLMAGRVSLRRCRDRRRVQGEGPCRQPRPSGDAGEDHRGPVGPGGRILGILGDAKIQAFQRSESASGRADHADLREIRRPSGRGHAASRD